MASKAWKELEKHVAEKLGGRRLSSASYAVSQPDVVVDTVNNPALGAAVYDKHISLIVECKYRQDQPWQRAVTEALIYVDDRIPLVTCQNMVFWDLKDTAKLMSFLFGLPPTRCNLVHVLQNFSIIPFERKVPLYIKQGVAQAECYVDWTWEQAVLWIPILCMGQKGKHHKIMTTDIKSLWGKRTEYGRRQAKCTHRGGAEPNDLE